MYRVLRRHVRHILLNLLSSRVAPAHGVHILNGHFLSLDNNRTGDVFFALCENLARHNVVFIDIQEATRRVTNHEYHADRCYVAFTFDDGFEECYTKLAPVLNHFKMKGAFFINPSFVNCDDKYKEFFLRNIVCTNSDKKPMTWEQITELARMGHVIGSHTMDHYKLDGYDSNYEFQIGESKKIIESKTGVVCEYFAYPYGRIGHFSPKALSIAASSYKYIFSQDDARHYYSFNGKVINRRHFEPDWPYRHVLYFLKAKS